MDLYSPWVVVCAVLIAMGTTAGLQRWMGEPAAAGRYATVDGLRGFLALFVFLHHGSIWFVYLRGGQWISPASNLFQHLGDSSVALFFMITAFLFTAKVLAGKDRPVDWGRLYVSRVMRLLPLYLLAVGLMWVMAWVLMDGVRHVTLLQLLTEVRGWLFFTIRGAPPVNGMGDANQLMAGVTWSLPYEWWFYASLPAIGLLFGRRAPLGWLVFGVFNVLLFKAGWRLDSERLMPFIGGVLAAFAVRSEGLCRWARHPASGLAVLACLALTVAATRTAYEGTAVALLSGAFVLIACGSDVFGLFSAGASRMLGEATYSLYLLHGLMLSLVFRFFVGMPEAARWTPTQHWAVVLGLTVPLVGVSFLTYAWIEAPAQRSTSAVWARLQRRSTGAPAATSPL